MTPEERAKEIIGKAAMSRFPMWVDIEQEIAASIRAAENDALERAALKCEELNPWGNEAEDWVAEFLKNAAISIRELKHGNT